MKEGLEKDTKKVDSLTVKDGENNSEIGKKKGKEERPPTKVVVRRLPPTMTEEEFLQQIEPLPPVDYKYYVPADSSLSPNSFCRAYLNFINQSDIFIFTQKFDGYVFVDSKGLEYPAVVEFAPFQRIPKQRPGRKKDPKAGTLESDVTYTTFLEKLHAQIQETTSAGSNMKQHFFETNVNSGEDSKVSSTPLLDFLRTRHAERLRVREEKRKKDLERKRAREEQRRSAKKSEEEQAVLKVLPSHTTSNTKDKFKEKDMIKPVKKRSDERIKETKSRVGKSYAEERQKQLERREELRKKFSTTNAGNKSSKTLKLQTDQKMGEPSATEFDKNRDSEPKRTESDQKIVENDVKKDLTHERKSYQHKYSMDSQRHYDHNKRDDDVKRRSRDGDRSNKSKELYHDRREDRDRMRKKVSENKKGYNRYDDYNKDKYKKEHSYKKEASSHNAADKKIDNEKKIEKVNSDSSNSSNNVKKDLNEIKKDDSKHETLMIKDDIPSGKNSESPVCKKDETEPDIDFERKVESSNDIEEISDELKNPDPELKNVELQQEGSVESIDKLPLPSREENPECENESETIKSGCILLNTSAICVNNSEGTEPEKLEKHSCVDEDEKANKIFRQNEMDISCCNEAESETTNTGIKSEKDEEEEEEEDLNSMAGSQKRGEMILKRRNSMEMYDRKVENNSNTNRRDNVRRSSLESGDQHSNSRQLKQEKTEKKKVERENSDSKPRDPRTERRIRNKDRPSMEIYRPGMGRFSKQRMEREKVLGSSTEVDSTSPSPSPTLVPKNKSSFTNNHNQDS